jgi:hypothetical protein
MGTFYFFLSYMCIPFISFCYLIALVKNSNTVLNKSGERNKLRLISDFRGNDFSFPPCSTILVIGLSYIDFIILRCIPSIPSFFGLLSWRDVEFCKGFFCTYWEDHVVFVPNLIYMLYYTCWFVYVDPFLYAWNETNLIMVYEFLMCCIWLVSILLKVFASIFIKEFGL